MGLRDSFAIATVHERDGRTYIREMVRKIKMQVVEISARFLK